MLWITFLSAACFSRERSKSFSCNFLFSSTALLIFSCNSATWKHTVMQLFAKCHLNMQKVQKNFKKYRTAHNILGPSYYRETSQWRICLTHPDSWVQMSDGNTPLLHAHSQKFLMCRVTRVTVDRWLSQNGKQPTV